VNKTVVLDTNVLLSDPEIISELGDADLVIPETVLAELDKLKTARVDPDLRFKGREISRMLFELSETGKLAEGVALPSGGTLRVVPFDSDADMPEDLSARNADDRILATAYRLASEEDVEVTLLTADLNMLLKAQSLGIAVERYRSESEQSFAKRYVIRPFQRYRVPLTILAIALAVFAGIVWVTQVTGRTASSASIPVEFMESLSTPQQNLLTYLLALQDNPNDLDTRLKLANLYYELFANTDTRKPQYAAAAIKNYLEYLKSRPDDLAAKTDLAAVYYYNGQVEQGIGETLAVLKSDPTQVQANFNLALMYWQGRRDLKSAAAQFAKVIALTNSGDLNAQGVNAIARQDLAALRKQADAAGVRIDVSVPATPTVVPHAPATSSGGAQ
jgi:rRNA maturation endonuclease Nob1